MQLSSAREDRPDETASPVSSLVCLASMARYWQQRLMPWCLQVTLGLILPRLVLKHNSRDCGSDHKLGAASTASHECNAAHMGLSRTLQLGSVSSSQSFRHKDGGLTCHPVRPLNALLCRSKQKPRATASRCSLWATTAPCLGTFVQLAPLPCWAMSGVCRLCSPCQRRPMEG